MTSRSQVARDSLTDIIPAGAASVLHVGCGDGRVGADYKRRNPACRFVGIDTQPANIFYAHSRLDAVHCSDIREADNLLAGQVFDCVIYAEDAASPFIPVRKLAGYVKQGGTLLLCLPNTPAHPDNAILESLDESGLFLNDRVPLRRAGVAAGIPAGLPFDIAGFEVGRDDHHQGAASHLVWRAGRTRPGLRLTLASTVLRPVGGVSSVRVEEPMRALGSIPGVKTILTTREALDLRQDGPKIFIFHRPLLIGADGLRKIERLVDAGWVVVCEFDDHPGYIPDIQRMDLKSFTAVHAIQTSTPALARLFSQYDTEIAVFENVVEAIDEPINFLDAARITFFFAGLNRQSEWPSYIAPINAAIARFGDRLHFEIVADRDFFDRLDTEAKNFTPVCSYDLYLEILARSEISFMPLSDNFFNRCKSDLKFIEAASRRVLPLASSVVYADSIEPGRTGLLFDTPASFERHLDDILSRPDFAASIASAARQHVIDHRMASRHVGKRLAWYESLWRKYGKDV